MDLVIYLICLLVFLSTASFVLFLFRRRRERRARAEAATAPPPPTPDPAGVAPAVPTPASRWRRFGSSILRGSREGLGFLWGRVRGLGRFTSTNWTYFLGWIVRWLIALTLIALVVSIFVYWSDLKSLAQGYAQTIRYLLLLHADELFAWIVWITATIAILPHLFTRANRKFKVLGVVAMGLVLLYLFVPTEKLAQAGQDIDSDPIIQGLYVLGAILGSIFLFKTVIAGFSTWMAGTNSYYWLKVTLLGFACLVLVAQFFMPNTIDTSRKYLSDTLYRNGLEFSAWFEGLAGSAYRQPSLEKLNNYKRERDELTKNYAGVKFFRGQFLLSEVPLRACRDHTPESCWGIYSPLFLEANNPKLRSQTPESLGVSCRTVKGGPVLMKKSETDAEVLIQPDVMMLETKGERWYRAQNPKSQGKIKIIISQSRTLECKESAPRPLPR